MVNAIISSCAGELLWFRLPPPLQISRRDDALFLGQDIPGLAL